MTFLAPAFLGLAMLMPLVIALYFLKSKPTRRTVPTTLIWKLVLERLRPNSFMQRFQNSLFLILQLLAMAAMVLALARPLGWFSARTGRVIILDVSASMASTDVAPNRFEQARSRALSLFDTGDRERTRVYLLRDRLVPLVTTGGDDLAIRHALAQVPLEHASTPDTDVILRELRRVALREQPDEIIVLSDCLRLQPDPDLLAGIGFAVEIFGQDRANVGLVGAELAGVPGGDDGELQVSVMNQGSREVAVTLEARSAGAGEPSAGAGSGGGGAGRRQTVRIVPNHTERVRLTNLPSPPFAVDLSCDADANRNPADDHWYVGAARHRPKVMVRAPAGSIIHQIRVAMPMIEFADLDQVGLASGVAAVISMGPLPPVAASVSALVFVPGRTPAKPGEVLPWSQSHPLLAFTDWDAVAPAALRPAKLPGIPIVEAIRGTLLSEEWQVSGSRRIGRVFVALAIDEPALEGNLFLPVLLYNAIEYLLGDAFPRPWYPVGHPGLLRLGGPNPPRTAGLHDLGNDVRVAVNLESAREADIAPGLPIELSRTHQVGRDRAAADASPWWIILALGSAVVLGEWWLYLRQT